MKRLLSMGLAVAFLLMAAMAAFAADEGIGAAESQFKGAFPRFHVDSFKNSPLKGIYEVVTGGNILYFFPEDGGYLIFGEIMNKDGKSITADRRAAMIAGRVKDLSLTDAFKIGHGKTKVIEISDPDCPYCRKVSDFFSQRTDVTRYVFFFPLPMHPEAAKHAMYILAKNTGAAYEEVYTGQLDKKNVDLTPEAEKAAEERLKAQEAAVVKLGVRGTPAFFINGQFVNGANIPAIDKLLGEETKR